MQRLLARFGYIRLADHGLFITAQGVVRSQQPWHPEPSSLPYGAPMGDFRPPPFEEQAQVLVGHQAAESLTPSTINESAESLLAPRGDTDGEGSTTVAQPLAAYRLPLSASHELPSADVRSSKWGNPEANATIVADSSSLLARTLQDDEEKTLFSPPPIHSDRVSTPPP